MTDAITQITEPRTYTFKTESHQPFVMPSIESYFAVHHEGMFVQQFPQECATGEFHSDGWMSTMRKKVEYVLYSIEQRKKDWFIHADIDIEYTKPVIEDLEARLQSHDFVAMDDNMFCAGFFAMRVNSKTVQLWENVYEHLHKFKNDQIAMNYWIRDLNVKAAKLPRFEYFNYMHLWDRDTLWEGDEDILREKLREHADQLESMRLVHANYIIGVDKKVRFLEIMRNWREFIK